MSDEPKVERINGILCLCWHGDSIPLRYIGSCLGEMVLQRDAEIERLTRLWNELEATVGDTLHDLGWIELEERFRTSQSPLHQRLSMVLHVMHAVYRQPN